MRSPTSTAPEMASGTGSVFSCEPHVSADHLLDHQRRAEREQQPVERVLAVGAAQAQLEQHAEGAHQHRRRTAARSRSARPAAARTPFGPAGSRRWPIRNSATYAPSANSDPWARLITSITPTISMKPSAISANSSPSDSPLTTCGRRLAYHRTALTDFVRRRRFVGLQLAGPGRVLVLARPAASPWRGS